MHTCTYKLHDIHFKFHCTILFLYTLVGCTYTLFITVNLGRPSGVMVPDDLHKATEQYSELQQQEAKEEESFNEGFDSILLLMIMFLIQN